MSEFIRLKDGGLYFGELNSDGLPESEMASCRWENRTYMGSWVYGTMSGIGTLYDENGKVIHHGFWWKGEFLNEIAFQPTIPPQGSVPPQSNFPSGNQPPINKNKNITALLVGNCNYGGDNDLNNCIEDTKAVECKMHNMGIDVFRIENGSESDIESSLDQLCKKSSQYENALFYFSGHGCTYQGLHYICSSPNSKVLCLESIELKLKNAGFKYRILIEDACNTIVTGRGGYANSPIKEKFNSEIGGSLMAFATGLGQESWDGFLGQHSPFTFALLQYLESPNMGVVELFNHVYEFTVEYARRELHKIQEPYLIFQHIPHDFTLYPLIDG